MRNFQLPARLFVISFLTAALINFLRPPAQFLRSDMVAYTAASHIFYSGGDPYSSSQVFELQRSMGYGEKEPILIWNPPVIFIVFGFFFILPPFLLSLTWQTLVIFSGFFLLLLGWECASSIKIKTEFNSSPKTLLYLCFILFTSFPFIIDIYLIQISAVLCAIIACGMILFFRKKYFLSGLFLSAVLIKPHLAFLPVVLLGLWVLRERRFSLILGAVTGLTLAFLSAEFINHGITMKWLLRKEWPHNLLGSSTSSIFSALFQSNGMPFPFYLKTIIPIAGTVLFFLWRGRKALNPGIQEMLIAAAFSPLVTPYGYLFDQIIMLPVMGYYAAKAFQKSESSGIHAIMILCTISIITCSFSTFAPFAVPFSWFLYPPLFIAAFFASKRAYQL
jgi:hypothetical protein